ncbi:putative plant self-incompatibility S1 [Helianthus anomalus]
MAKKISNFLVVLACLTSFLITPSYTCWAPFRWSILITNGIQNSTISVHVQSKDDDLRFHNVTYNNGYSMFFCERLIQSTLFWVIFPMVRSLHFLMFLILRYLILSKVYLLNLIMHIGFSK